VTNPTVIAATYCIPQRIVERIQSDARNDFSEQLNRYKAALEKIASFGEGPVVTTSFDEPGAAKIAREALNPPTA
jgi:hypothetical protein